MKVYVYQAGLYCAHCGLDHREGLDIPPGADLTNESTWDSDAYPKGPYPNGGGEADCPQHCDGCGLFLENPLTDDGDKYVRQAVADIPALDIPDGSWSEIADKAETIGHPHLADWIRFYFAQGL